eukprot:GSMAST32.ASY1.ANO1.1245.1 assembled CDS
MANTYDTHSYIWIVIVGGIATFVASLGIGANDVANCIATAVGAKSITQKQGMLLASFFEFVGAVLFGSGVTETIRKGIANEQCFESNPVLLMYGMLCVQISIAIWLGFATFLKMPVSTTHSCVGSIVGMTMVLADINCVKWYERIDTFPYISGISGILVSWFVAPVLSTIFANALFLIVRTFILRSNNSYERAYSFYPVVVFSTFTICFLFIILKTGSEIVKNLNFFVALSISAGLALILSLLMVYKTNTKRTSNPVGSSSDVNTTTRTAMAYHKTHKTDAQAKGNELGLGLKAQGEQGSNKEKQVFELIKDDLDVEIFDNEETMAVHKNAEIFDEKTEAFFKYVQVFTCCCGSFSHKYFFTIHGANDISNSIGPFASIYMIYKSNMIASDQQIGSDAYWILSIGAVGLVLGLYSWGYKIMDVLGTEMLKVCTGFAIELGSVSVIIFGTQFGLPYYLTIILKILKYFSHDILSTTHCQVGATCGVAWAEGQKGVNYSTLKRILIGWVGTLVVSGGTAGALAFMWKVFLKSPKIQ